MIFADAEGLTYGSNAAFLGNWLAGGLPTEMSYGAEGQETAEMAGSPGAEGYEMNSIAVGAKMSSTSCMEPAKRPGMPF